MSSKNEKLVSPPAKYILLLIGVVALTALLVIMVLSPGSPDTPPNPTAQTPPPISADIDQESLVFLRVGLIPSTGCDAVLNYYKEHALQQVTPWGLEGRWGQFANRWDEAVLDVAEQDSITTSSSEPRQAGGESSYSTTNIQVEGVDEADIVKTDGDYIYVFSHQRLKIIDIRQAGAANAPSVIAEIDLDFYVAHMLLSLKPAGADNLSDTLIVVGQPAGQQLRLVQINIDERTSPKVVADFTLDGNYTGIRLADNVVRLVTTSQPLGFDWKTPAGSGLRAEEQALKANQELIRNSELNNWVPAYKDNLQEDSETGSLVDCSQMLVPNVFSGLNTLSIMTFNASENLSEGNWQAIGLAADGQQIYATADHVYVATAEWVDEAEPATAHTPAESNPTLTADFKTIIHKFGTQQPEASETEASRTNVGRPIYRASGEVTGTLLNQFSMDEYQGDLRVAVTLDNFDENTQENHIKILRPDQGVLEEIGTIAGLGIDERIFAVRFMGPQAYIVTFRQIDPLYALDLSDPTAPKALGELKITGFSSYLHPVGENLLLGIGQEADQDGFIEGLQISLFDTSDPTNPQRIDQLLLDDALDLSETDDTDTTGSSSPVEHDHRAFLFYEDSAFIPYNIYWSSRSPRAWGNEAGILVLEIENGALAVTNALKAVREKDGGQAELGTAPDSLRRPVAYLEPIRTIVVGDLVYGITGNGELIVWLASTGELLHLTPN